MNPDNINPENYRNRPIECIEYTQWLGFCPGNAFKYIWRHDGKNGLEDLKKAEWYLLRQIGEEPHYAELDPDCWADRGMRLHDIAYTFSAVQHQALQHIWAFAAHDSYHDLHAALACVRSLMAQYGQEAV